MHDGLLGLPHSPILGLDTLDICAYVVERLVPFDPGKCLCIPLEILSQMFDSRFISSFRNMTPQIGQPSLKSSDRILSPAIVWTEVPFPDNCIFFEKHIGLLVFLVHISF